MRNIIIITTLLFMSFSTFAQIMIEDLSKDVLIVLCRVSSKKGTDEFKYKKIIKNDIKAKTSEIKKLLKETSLPTTPVSDKYAILHIKKTDGDLSTSVTSYVDSEKNVKKVCDEVLQENEMIRNNGIPNLKKQK